MKKNLTLIILSFLAIFVSCKEEKKEGGPSQMDQVMAIHDEVMPKMGQLSKLVGYLKPMADSLGAESKQAKAMKDLQDANKSMMEWMQGFGDKFDSEEILEGKALSPEKQKMLNEEEAKVRAVKEKINASISQAEALIDTTN
ncbi:hypothetical protein ACOCEA_06050 [Maribacter sp. CXY002]|uniref:hypothetical protein n=1 Tax=Maribacter luteocoastalis TaxID=3407671 RepID=UPI003B67AE00